MVPTRGRSRPPAHGESQAVLRAARRRRRCGLRGAGRRAARGDRPERAGRSLLPAHLGRAGADGRGASCSTGGTSPGSRITPCRAGASPSLTRSPPCSSSSPCSSNVWVAVQCRRTILDCWRAAAGMLDVLDRAREILAAVELESKAEELAANIGHGLQRHLEIRPSPWRRARAAPAPRRAHGGHEPGGDGARRCADQADRGRAHGDSLSSTR